MDVSNPSEFPDPTKIATIEEPYVKAQIMVPQEFVGADSLVSRLNAGQHIELGDYDMRQHLAHAQTTVDS